MTWIVVPAVIAGLFVFFISLKKKQMQMEKNFQEKFAGRNVRFMDKYALFVAQQSDGYSHTRGIGYMVLTDEELHYERQFGNKVLSIPLSSITHVGETLRLAGQCTGRLMLKVDFKNQDGTDDAVGWRVKDLERWKTEISALTGSSK